MGSIFSRWRSKPSTIEVLEAIDKDISYIEKAKQSDLRTQKKVVGALILYSAVLYLIALAVYYFYYMPEGWSTLRLLHSTPLLIFPILVYLVKKFLHWYFVKRISKNETVLDELKDKKKTILDEVMEKETYKKAKEILQRFDPDKLITIEDEAVTPASLRVLEGQELRQRPLSRNDVTSRQPTPIRPQAQSTPLLRSNTIASPQAPTPISVNGGGRNMSMPQGTPRHFTGPPMPRPILPRDRTTVDKLVEFLVGDGPSNRYALICNLCCSHNGMALKEEFEYLSFRCCYCYTLNPARKQRPNAPRLPQRLTEIPQPNTAEPSKLQVRRQLVEVMDVSKPGLEPEAVHEITEGNTLDEDNKPDTVTADEVEKSDTCKKDD